jgi:sRNA-binding protein
MVDRDGVRDSDGGGGHGGGREGLELVESDLEADPPGLVQREVEIPHVHQAVSEHRRRRRRRKPTELRKESRAAKTLAEAAERVKNMMKPPHQPAEPGKTARRLGWAGKTPKRLALRRPKLKRL